MLGSQPYGLLPLSLYIKGPSASYPGLGELFSAHIVIL